MKSIRSNSSGVIAFYKFDVLCQGNASALLREPMKFFYVICKLLASCSYCQNGYISKFGFLNLIEICLHNLNNR